MSNCANRWAFPLRARLPRSWRESRLIYPSRAQDSARSRPTNRTTGPASRNQHRSRHWHEPLIPMISRAVAGVGWTGDMAFVHHREGEHFAPPQFSRHLWKTKTSSLANQSNAAQHQSQFRRNFCLEHFLRPVFNSSEQNQYHALRARTSSSPTPSRAHPGGSQSQKCLPLQIRR